MEITDKDIELVFHEEVLTEHGEYMLKLFRDTINDKNIRLNDELTNSLKYEVVKSGTGWQLNISFLQYGRFLEIRNHKHKMNRRQNEARLSNKMLWGEKLNSMEAKKYRMTHGKPDPSKPANAVDWYSKNAYGSLNRLVGRLLYELSEETRQRLKEQLTARLSNSQSI